MGKKIIEWFIIAVGILLLLYQLVFYAYEVTKLVRWSHSGDLEVIIEKRSDDAPYLFSTVDTLAFITRPCPSVGDTLVALIDSTGALDLDAFFNQPVFEPGRRLSFSFRQEGQVHTGIAVAREQVTRDLVFIVIIEVLRFLITISYLLVGLWAFLKRPHSGGVRTLALFSFAMAAFMITSVSIIGNRYATFEIPGQDVIIRLLDYLAFCFGAFWLNLQLYFPRPFKLVVRRPIPIHLLVYAPQVLWFTLVPLLRKNGIHIAEELSGILMAIQVFAGFKILVSRQKKSREPLEIRQLSLVLSGSGIGLGALFVLAVIVNIPGLIGSLPELVFIAMINIVFLALLLSPISFAYAFGRYRLLEVEGSLRRGTRYVLVTVVLLIAFFGLLYAASGLLLNTLNMASRTPTLAIALLLALSFAPVHRRVQEQVERRFYPERTRLRTMLSEFIASASTMPDRATLWQRLEENLKKGLGISAVIPLLRNKATPSFYLPDGKPVPVDLDGAMVKELEQKARPLLVDEVVASGRVFLDDAERKWLESRKIALLLPMIINSELIGLVAITFEHGREDMAAEDLGVLSSLASQVALQNENLRLQEENFEKRRLEEQLELARQVQQQFLPRKLPSTPGLEVAADCLFSLEVAGDYYDVISLSDNRTALVVGDVSGKGAGAAMIMANLQASLRTALHMDFDLAETVARVNDLICDNTAPEEYITFFVAVYDPSDSGFTYVNAGHNQPRVLGEGGRQEILDVGGPVLGVIPGLSYEQGRVKVSNGDLFLAFTDGVSEAMNDADEEFCEERIFKIAQAELNQPTETILRALEEQVNCFRGDRPLGDDFTLLICRVIS